MCLQFVEQIRTEERMKEKEVKRIEMKWSGNSAVRCVCTQKDDWIDWDVDGKLISTDVCLNFGRATITMLSCFWHNIWPWNLTVQSNVSHRTVGSIDRRTSSVQVGRWHKFHWISSSGPLYRHCNLWFVRLRIKRRPITQVMLDTEICTVN